MSISSCASTTAIAINFIFILKKSIPTQISKFPISSISLHPNKKFINNYSTASTTNPITTHISKISTLLLASSSYNYGDDVTSELPETPPPELTPPYIHEEPTSIPIEVPVIPTIPEVNPIPPNPIPPPGSPDFPDPGPPIPSPPVPDIPLPPPDILPPSTPPDITPPPRPPAPGDFPPPLQPPPDGFPPAGPAHGW